MANKNETKYSGKHAFIALFLCALVYIALSAGLFGSPLLPLLAVTTVFEDAEGIQSLCLAFFATGGLIAGVTGFALHRSGAKLSLTAPAMLAAWMISSTLIAGLTLDAVRSRVTQDFAPDEVRTRSAFSSFRRLMWGAPFHPHSLALKDCDVYNYSHRQQIYTPLPSNIAANVAPQDWIKTCGIVRSSSPTP